MQKTLFTAFCAAALCACGGEKEVARPEAAPPSGAVRTAPVVADEARLEADVRALSDDSMQGREAGTPGYDKAAAYVASRFEALGLRPLASGDYFQPVPMVEYGPEEGAQQTLSLTGDEAPASFLAGDHYIAFGSSGKRSGVVEAPVVFVGFGLVAEDYGRDDYAGLEVDGTIVADLAGAPKFLNSEERAHYSATRSQRASERGAIATITLYTPTLAERLSWEDLRDIIERDTSMSWRQESGEPFSRAPNIMAGAIVSLEGAAAFFENAPTPWSEIEAAAETEAGEVRGFELGMTARIDYASFQRDLSSNNVIGVLPGTDPALAGEYLVVTGHLDHEGVKPTTEEGDDEIYNGAMDNATGIAAIMEVARLLKQNPPRRPVMFVGLTAEEKGLVGSDYLAQNPPMTDGEFVANINLDMPILNYAFTDVVAFGGERTTMYPYVQTATERAGLTLSPDPQPDEGFFTRSDQYRFVQQGIPALYLDLGFANGGEEAQGVFLKEHYHRVSDEADLIDYDALQRFTQVNYEIVGAVADMDERPLWKKGDFFARTFGGPTQE